MVFVHGSFRYDATSVFYSNERKLADLKNLYRFPYYGGDISVVLTEAFPSIKSDFLTFLENQGKAPTKMLMITLDLITFDATFSAVQVILMAVMWV